MFGTRLWQRLRGESLFNSIALVTCTGLMVPAFLIGVYWNGVHEQASAEQQEHEAMSARLKVLAASLPTMLWNLDLSSARPLVDAVMASPEVVRVTVYDRGQGVNFLDVALPERREGRSMVTAQELVRGNDALGTLTIEVDDSIFLKEVSHHRLVYVATVTSQVLMSLGLILWMLSSRVLRPLRELDGFAVEMSEGRFDTRLVKRHDDEIGQLGRRLVDTRDHIKALFAEQAALFSTVRAREAEVSRLSGFYRALTRTNQAISRVREEDTLLREICNVCVEEGHLVLAAATTHATVAPPDVVLVGDARFPLAGLREAWNAPGDRTLSRSAMETGTRAIRQDVLADSSDRPLDDLSLQFGVRSIAAYPLKRSDTAVGHLTLYAATTGFFDDAVADLFGEMAHDLSEALDRLDRDAERVSALAEARAGMERFSRLFHGAPVSMSIISSGTGRIIEVNEAFCQRWGVDRADVLGLLESQVGIGLLPEDRVRLEEALTRDHRVRNFVGRGRFKDGRPCDMLLSGELLEYRSQLCMVISTLDLSDVEDAKVAREAQRLAETESRAKSEFISRMSHEFRTPLNAVLGFSQVLRVQAQDRLSVDEIESLQHIERAGRHLLNLINDLLDVAQIEEGRINVDTQDMRLAPAVQAAVKMIKPLADEYGVRIRPIACPADIHVMADPLRLHQTLLNLISNAIKYNRRDGELGIEVRSADGDPSSVRLSITDTGIGMTSEQLAHLYEPFNRLGRQREGIEGTGLGLALTRQLVELMGGQLRITSEPGVGSTATVTLRAAGALDTTAGSPEPPRTAERAPHGNEPPPEAVVLYIEDNPVNVVLVQHMLARFERITLLVAPDGESGLERAHLSRPDLILLDLQLPDIDGLQVLDRLRASETTKDIRVVAVSASAMPEEVETAARRGVSDYWTKPLDLEQFLVNVSRIIWEVQRGRE